MTITTDDCKPIEERKEFDIVLIDIENTNENKKIQCIKRNMYDPDLEYIAISYRWGEVPEQLVKTPDYTAHIVSFDVYSLVNLCLLIQKEPDLKEIRYLWVDGISVNQHNHAMKKSTILKMSTIYQRATFILAVPDLHDTYLYYNTGNSDLIDLLYTYRDTIHQAIFNHDSSSMINPIDPNKNRIQNDTPSMIQQTAKITTVNEEMIKKMEKLRKENEALKMEMKSNELKKLFQFLAYLINDWSNRVWVISECQIAREKYIQYGTPLKYIFLSLLVDKDGQLAHKPFFSYHFIDQHKENETIEYYEVNNGPMFLQFLESVFTQRSPIDMLMASNATRNEDRFYAILPTWKEKKHLIQNNSTITDWQITDMTTVRLKMYELIYDDDHDDHLWHKARLLYMCTNYNNQVILPSFATHQRNNFNLFEINNIGFAHKRVLHNLSELDPMKEYVKNHINQKEEENESIFQQNLIDLQFNQQQCHLSIKVNDFYIFNEVPNLHQEELSDYSLLENDDLVFVYLPYFIYDLPELNRYFILNKYFIPILSGTLLLGNKNINRWIIYPLWDCKSFDTPSFHSTNDYVFHIY